MVKSLFAGRRKSQGNVIEDGDAVAVAHDITQGVESGSGGFRVMTSTEADARKREEKRRASERAASKFRPFSGFGGNKSRNQSVDDESSASSKRDSKSSSGTGGSRPYNNGQFGSTSTLPSSADTDSNDNLFAVSHRPHFAHQHSSPGLLSTSGMKKQLPTVPQADSRYYAEPVASFGRARAMTSSSYASTAKPPTLDADLDFGSSSFDNMFSGLDRKESPEVPSASPGRSLLMGKRTFQAEPIQIDRTHELEVEAPLTSWESRDSTDNLMSPSPDRDSPPPPPPHKFSQSQQYARVATHSPELNGSNDFAHSNTYARQPLMTPKPVRDDSQEVQAHSLPSVPPYQAPLSSQSTSNDNTPKPPTRSAPSLPSENDDDDDDDLFAPPKPSDTPASKPAAPTSQDNRPPPPTSDDSARRILTQAQFKEQQRRAALQVTESDSEPEDYDDEEEAQEKAAQEAIARRKKQQMDLARESMRRTTTAPGHPNKPDSMAEPFSMGFPSEISNTADQWEDEDVPLGILALHGFPGKDKLPQQPANGIPSYYRNSSSSTVPDRPQSAGNLGANRASVLPAFARGLPQDPHTSYIGGGLIQPTIRESMGFSRGPGSMIGDGSVLQYPEPQLTAPSLVEQIHMRDMSKPKYMGGASNKKPQGGPFTGAMGAQMNPAVNNPIRMSMMPGMNQMQGMQGMQQMNPMMSMNMMGAPQMAGMNGMAYPMSQQDYMQQMQQMQQMQHMLAAQQMQLQQMQQMQQQPQDPRMSMTQSDPRMSMMQPDPRMSMALPGGKSFLNVPGAQQQRPMSIMSSNPQQQFQQRSYSASNTMFGGSGYQAAAPPLPGYAAPSIAPSERSTVGLSARYRPVATNNDNQSTVSSSMTLQASSGAVQSQIHNPNPNTIPAKGILKKGVGQGQQQPTAAQERIEEDDYWSKIALKKSRFGRGGKKKGNEELGDLMRGMENL